MTIMYCHHLQLPIISFPLIIYFKESFKKKKMKTHLTFFWGNTTEIVFAGWPGQGFSSYMVALVSVFVVGFVVEWLSHTRFIKSTADNITAGLVQTTMYAVRIGLAYLLMLAVMSFNVGVLLAAVGGCTVGFFIFGSRVFVNSKTTPFQDPSDLPPLNC
jgi:copper transporter 1